MVERVREHEFPGNVELADLQIPAALSNTIEDHPQAFLLEDNLNNDQRLITFASPPCLRLLSQAADWFVDGNFSMAPRHFLQLYIIRVPLSETCITAAYCIMQRKTRNSYSELLRTVINNCLNLGHNHPHPQRIHCDFEIAMHQAIRDVFPNSQVTGCFYHLTQVYIYTISFRKPLF